MSSEAKVNVHPLEKPDGARRIFTLPDVFAPNTVQCRLQGIGLEPGDEFEEGPEPNQVTILFDEPLIDGDKLRFNYQIMKTVSHSAVLFGGLELNGCSLKATHILDELQSVNHERCPNLAGSGIRILLELVVDDFLTMRGWTSDEFKGKNLQHKIQKCLIEIDPSSKDRRFTGIKKASSHPEQLLAVNTFNGYIHNPYFQASPTDVRTLAANYREFLTALDTLLMQEK